jgi:hypothetical protein
MRILLTNNTLSRRAGTELYCRDISFALKAAGHEVWCYSRSLGEVADELREGGIAVFDRLDALPGLPDIIHGHHRLETAAAGLYFPSVPVISFCHGPKAWQERPCRLPNVVLWVAVDLTCEARLIEEEGIPPSSIRLLFNFVDTSRFTLRSPLPATPRRALVFSNAASDATQLPALRRVCRARGIALDVIGLRSGNSHSRPEAILGSYDLVFAKARAALEAMASGCAVVQCDHFGAGRLVTSSNFDEIKPLNFGFRSMPFPVDDAYLGAEVDRYDAADARAVALRVRAECSLAATLPRLLQLYAEALAGRRRPDEASMSRAAALLVESEIDSMKLGRNGLHGRHSRGGWRARLARSRRAMAALFARRPAR